MAVQKYGCWALCIISDNNEANKLKAGEADAIQAVVAAMAAHLDTVAVQKYGCWALCNISDNNDANKLKAGEAGAIEAVVAATRGHPDSADVQSVGCAAMLSLTMGNTANQTKAIALGAVNGVANSMEAVLTAMRLFPDSKDLLEQGCRALEVTWAEAGQQRQAHQAAAIEALQAAKAKFPTGHVADRAAAALAVIRPLTDSSPRGTKRPRSPGAGPNGS
jgi:hypothetical protein